MITEMTEPEMIDYLLEGGIVMSAYDDDINGRTKGMRKVFDDRTHGHRGYDSRDIARRLFTVGILAVIGRRNKRVPWGLGNRVVYVNSEDADAARGYIKVMCTTPT